MKIRHINAANLHKNVPPDWYFTSIRENVLQRYWHTRRFREVEKIIDAHGAKKILDIGSADGVFTNVIAKKTGAEVVGIDVLKSSVDWANNHWKNNSRIKFLIGDAHKLKFKSSSFDAVFALEVLEHVEDPPAVLKEIRRVLKTGGYAVFLVPTDSFIFKTLWDLVWTKTRGKIWNDTHIQTYKNDKLINICKKAGFTVVKEKKFILGMLQIIKLAK